MRIFILIAITFSFALHAQSLVRLRSALSPTKRIALPVHDAPEGQIPVADIQIGDRVSFLLFKGDAFIYLQQAVTSVREKTMRYVLSQNPSRFYIDDEPAYEVALKFATWFNGIVGEDITLARLRKLSEMSQGPGYVPPSMSHGTIRPQPVPTPQILGLKVIRVGSRGAIHQTWPPCETKLLPEQEPAQD